MSARPLPLAGCSFGWLHVAPLQDALEALARHGIRALELSTVPPHLFTPHLGAYERLALARALRARSLRVVSVNPSFVDLNLISTNPEIREASERQLCAELELASELEAPFVVVLPGRRHGLAPAREEDALAVLHDALERLLGRAIALGVTIALENSPYGYLGTVEKMVGVVGEWESPHLRLTYDAANALAQEDPAEGVRRAAPYLGLAHVSDTWRERWAHTSIGRGEVDFVAFADALREIGFDGWTVYEMVDGEDPGPRLAADLGRLRAAGWSVSEAVLAGAA